MKTIDLNQDIKKQFEKEGLAYPILKNNKKWGLRQSSLLDRDTEEESKKAVLNYLTERKIIIITKMKKRNLEYEKKFRAYLFKGCGERHKAICENLNIKLKEK